MPLDGGVLLLFLACLAATTRRGFYVGGNRFHLAALRRFARDSPTTTTLTVKRHWDAEEHGCLPCSSFFGKGYCVETDSTGSQGPGDTAGQGH